MQILKLCSICILAVLPLACTINNAPEIISLTANPSEVFADEKSELNCEASSSYGSNIDYSWYSSHGTLPEITTDQNLIWIAPSEPGNYDIIIDVSDGVSTTTDTLVVSVILNNIQYLTLRDSRDGKTYQYFTFMGQSWMAENLAFLPEVSRSEEGADDFPHYYVYDYQGNNVSAAKLIDNYSTYGVLYNWEAAMISCPTGWHLPTDKEWKALETNMGMEENDANDINWRNSGEVGYYMKSKEGWIHEGNGVNRVGFNALPGGYRYGGSVFDFKDDKAFFWTSTQSSTNEAWARYLYYQNEGVYRYDDRRKRGFSVRCVK